MVGCLLVGEKKGCMKDIVNPPVVWQLQPIGYWRNDLNDGERAIALWV
jgi:hypothetical protein